MQIRTTRLGCRTLYTGLLAYTLTSCFPQPHYMPTLQGVQDDSNTKITINLRKKTPQRYGETQSYTKNSVFLRASPYLCVNFWRILNFILV
jgi:hypothetical protein